MGKAFTDEEKAMLRERLIEIAEHAFEKQHFNDVKVEDLAKSTGISKGAFYAFYKSKEEIFIDVLIRFEAKMQREMLMSLVGKATLRDQLIELLISAIQNFEKSYLYKSFEDPGVQVAVLSKATELQRNQMLLADQKMLEFIVGDGSALKVDKEVALDMMRSLFFMIPYKTQLTSDFELFISAYVTAIVEGIIHKDAPALVLPTLQGGENESVKY